MDGWIDGQIDGWMDGWMDRHMGGKHFCVDFFSRNCEKYSLNCKISPLNKVTVTFCLII